MKHEFEALANVCIIDDNEWDMIHTVYQFHSGIDDFDGKNQIVKLWLRDQDNHYSNDIETMFKEADEVRQLTRAITKARIYESNLPSMESKLKELTLFMEGKGAPWEREQNLPDEETLARQAAQVQELRKRFGGN